jgi:hypothetical protein
MTYVGQLFGKTNLTVCVTSLNTEYPEGILEEPCRTYHQMQKSEKYCKLQGCTVTGIATPGGFKQKECRDAGDAAMPSPLSFFTRREERIPVLTLDLFVTR